MAYKVGRCLLQELLIATRMDQSELARRVGVTRQQINKYANNNQGMSLEVSKNIAAVLRCDIEDLYEWIEVGNNE